MPPLNITKDKNEVLRHVLQKLQTNTPITSIGPGSVARAFSEAIVNELGDFYSILDFNTSMSFIGTATGRGLDLIGQLYDVERKTLGEVATIEQSVGAFYFYIDSPHSADIVIPEGTMVYTDVENYIGEQYSYTTIKPVIIAAGRTRAYASIRPLFGDSIFTAGEGTITRHNLESPQGVVIRCTNPKTIAAQPGYESDANYRTRIIKAVRTAAGGTVEAVRFAGLSVQGVRDVKVRNTPYGLGSVEALVVPENRQDSEQVMANVREALMTVRPVGVRLLVRQPDYTMCEVRATIVIRDNVRVEPTGTSQRAKNGIVRYLNTLMPGAPLVYSQLLQSVLDASDAIADVSIDRMRVAGTEILRRNFTPETDQQIVPGTIEVATA